MSRGNSWRILLLTFGLTVAVAIPVRGEDFFLKDGDVVVMIGDSITEQHLYSNFVEMWTITRFPNWHVTFRNVGIGGDRSVGGNERFARDVLLHQPTAMTVDFGMNDGGYREFSNDTYRPYMEGLQGMAHQAQAAHIRAAWITPQPLDTGDAGPTALTGYNQTLEKFSAGVQEIADKNHGLYVDQFHPYLAALDRARGQAVKYERITGGDAVHPGPPGQALMAASILQGLHFPSLVSAAVIDATSKNVVAARNCTIDHVVVQDGGVSFSRLDGALPFFPAEATSILPFAPILDELNEYTLKVTGLAAGKYEVRVSGTKIAELTDEQLSAGTNLASAALAAGAIADQVHAVRAAVENKNRYHHDHIFRGVTLAHVDLPDWLNLDLSAQAIEAKRKAAVTERLTQLAKLDADVAKTLVMKSNTVDIVPIK